MNNLERIIEKINSDAASEAEAIRSEAALEADRIRKETEAVLDEITAETEERATKEYHEIIERAESSGSMAEREIILSAKASLIDKAYSDAEEYICNLPSEKYTDIMASLLGEAIIESMNSINKMTEMYNDENFKGDDKLSYEVIMSESDRDSCGGNVIRKTEMSIANRDIFVPKIKLSKDTCSIKGGFILKHGDIETNCSVSDMINGIKDRTYTAVANILFPE